MKIKKTYFVAILLLVLLFSACGKEEPDSEVLKEPEITAEKASETLAITEEKETVTIERDTKELSHKHAFSVATCAKAATCSCGETVGAALGHSYERGVCIRCSDRDPNYHEHSYAPADCTTAATCSCGAKQGNPLGHSFSKGVCARCQAEDPAYAEFLVKALELTLEYDEKILEVDEKIEKCEKNISTTETALSNARGELLSLSPVCPQWYIQQYVSNYQQYGSSYAATQAAQSAWTQQYNSKRSSLTNTISMSESYLASEKQNLQMYNMIRNDYITRYNRELEILCLTYGVE